MQYIFIAYLRQQFVPHPNNVYFEPENYYIYIGQYMQLKIIMIAKFGYNITPSTHMNCNCLASKLTSPKQQDDAMPEALT